VTVIVNEKKRQLTSSETKQSKYTL